MKIIKALKVKSILKYVLPVIIVAILFSIWHFQRKIITVTETRLVLGTIVEITVQGKDRGFLTDAVSAAFLRISEIEKIADRYSEESEISKLNSLAMLGELKEIPVSRETLEMLNLAKGVSESSGGSFDITVAPLVDLWDFKEGGQNRGIPEKGEIRERLKLVDYRNVVIKKNDNLISSNLAGIKFDLGGIAKGYAMDEAALVLRGLGVESGVVNAGGDMAIIGNKAGGKPWVIGVQDPRDANKLIALLSLEDVSVVTSGDYERYFIHNGVRYHHIIDPRNGSPSNESISVTVIAKNTVKNTEKNKAKNKGNNTALADALATAIFVLGPEKGLELAEGLDSVEVLIVGPSGKTFATTGLTDIVEYLD